MILPLLLHTWPTINSVYVRGTELRVIQGGDMQETVHIASSENYERFMAGEHNLMTQGVPFYIKHRYKHPMSVVIPSLTA